MRASVRVVPVVVVMAVSAALAREARAQDPPTTPPPAVAPAPQRTLSSWTSDRRAFGVGDVLTVFVDERTFANARADEYASDDRRFSRSAAITPITRYGAILDGDHSSDQRGTARRDERFVTEISVRVVERGENGLVRVEGRKAVQVDDHQQAVVLRGWVRAQDISGQNIVDGWRVADLEILYESNGELTKPDKGMLQKLLSILF